MQYTYVNTTTSGTTPATVINSQGGSIVVRKLIIGNPLAGTITLFNEGNALANNTTNIASLITLPTFSTTNINGTFPIVVDYRTATGEGGSTEADGLTLVSGGTVSISAQVQLTILWDYSQG
jgi:hypothetical protein